MRFLWSSDQHTLHQTTPTYHILGNLSKFLLKDNDPAKVDMHLFGGDFMERLVESPNADMFKVADWGKSYLHAVYEANPKATVIFLEGTSSHDWEQPRHFLNWAPKGLDIRWINTLCIHTFEQYDNLSIMFVPDNMGTMTTDEIWELALKVLKESGLEKVDMICLHGGWDFQLHSKARHKGHIPERWESIVKYAIFTGHIHTPMQQGLKYSSGSFDRTGHGEEHPKGGYVGEIDKKKDYFNATFYENKNALPYLTIHVDKEVTAEALIRHVHDFIKQRKLVNHSQLRIKGGSAEIVNPVLEMLKNDYPNFGWKSDNEANKNMLVDETLFEVGVYEGVSLNKENIRKSLIPEVKEKLVKLNISEEDSLKVLEEFL